MLQPNLRTHTNLKKVLVTCIVLSIITGSMIYTIDYMFKEKINKSLVFQLAQIIKQNTDPQSLIIFTTAGDPTLMYISHRKGWLNNPTNLTEQYIKSKIDVGANYLVGSFEFVESYRFFVDDQQKQNINSTLSKYPNLLDSQKFFIADLHKTK